MTENLLISAVYSSENVLKAATRSAVDRLVLVADREGASTTVEDAIQDWEERARERERERTGEMVDSIISEHRAGEASEGDRA